MFIFIILLLLKLIYSFQITEDEYEHYQVGAVYLPPAALVHRCDKSVGCCSVSHQQCSVAVEELVTFVFEEILRGRKRKKEIVLTNHVRCQCRSVSWDAPRWFVTFIIILQYTTITTTTTRLLLLYCVQLLPIPWREKKKERKRIIQQKSITTP